MPHRSTRRAAKAALVIAAAALLTACYGGDGRSAEAALVHTPDLADLTDATWTADNVAGGDHELVPGSVITMNFTDDAISVNAGCNTMNGPASIDGDELVVGVLAATLMACDQPLTEQDAWLTAFLTSRPTIEWLDKDLWLSKGDTVIHFVADDD